VKPRHLEYAAPLGAVDAVMPGCIVEVIGMSDGFKIRVENPCFSYPAKDTGFAGQRNGCVVFMQSIPFHLPPLWAAIISLLFQGERHEYSDQKPSQSRGCGCDAIWRVCCNGCVCGRACQ